MYVCTYDGEQFRVEIFEKNFTCEVFYGPNDDFENSHVKIFSHILVVFIELFWQFCGKNDKFLRRME